VSLDKKRKNLEDQEKSVNFPRIGGGRGEPEGEKKEWHKRSKARVERKEKLDRKGGVQRRKGRYEDLFPHWKMLKRKQSEGTP